MSEINLTRIKEAATLVDHFVANQQPLRDIPGIVVAIGHGSEPIFQAAYGHANLERGDPMTAGHVFRIASHSKMFTAVSCMILVQRGKLRLDDTLGQYIDGLPGSVAQATIRQTLNHASGIVRDGADANYWQLDRPFPDGPALLELTQDILTPNTLFKYSNIGYSLVGMAVGKAAGKPYNQFVREAILGPLGMDHSGPDTDERSPDNLAIGYTGKPFPFGRFPIPDISTGAMSPATGFYSTAADLLRFAAANHFGNEAILTDASKREMQQPYWEVRNSDERYGLGFSVLKIGDRIVVGHGGSFPGHATRTWFDPEAKLTVVVLTNEIAGPSGILARIIFRIINKALSATDEKQRDDVDLDSFTGQFVGLWGTAEIVRFGGQLFGLTTSGDDPVASPDRLEVVDSDTLKIEDTGGYGAPKEWVRFVRDSSGKTVEIVYGGESSYPYEIMAERVREGIRPPPPDTAG